MRDEGSCGVCVASGPMGEKVERAIVVWSGGGEWRGGCSGGEESGMGCRMGPSRMDARVHEVVLGRCRAATEGVDPCTP